MAERRLSDKMDQDAHDDREPSPIDLGACFGQIGYRGLNGRPLAPEKRGEECSCRRGRTVLDVPSSYFKFAQVLYECDDRFSENVRARIYLRL
jgi:hypothetical protein